MSMILTKLRISHISSICCRDDADTTIVKESLQYSLLGNVGVVAEDADILIIMTRHFDINRHKKIRILTSKGHYSVNEIVNNLTPDEKLWSLLLLSLIWWLQYCFFDLRCKRNSTKIYVLDS